MAVIRVRHDIILDVGRYATNYGKTRAVPMAEMGVALLYAAYSMMRIGMNETQIYEALEQVAAWDKKNSPPGKGPVPGS